MPIGAMFQQHLDRIAAFLEDPTRRMHLVRCAPGALPLLLKMVEVWGERDPQFPHFLHLYQEPAGAPDDYFEGLLRMVAASNDRLRQQLAAVDPPIMLPEDEGDEEDPPHIRLAEYHGTLAESLPDCWGAYCLVLAPPRVDDAVGLREGLARLGAVTEGQWAKVMVLEDADAPWTSPPDEDPTSHLPGSSVQQMEITAQTMAAKVRQAVERGEARSAEEARGLTLLLGGFALGNGQWDEAAEQLDKAEQGAAGQAELAPVHYLHGRVHMGRAEALAEGGELAVDNELELAERRLERAVEAARDADNPGLVAAALMDAGEVVHKRDRTEEALECFDAARRIFADLNMPPGEVSALHRLGAVLKEAGLTEEAEQAWVAALGRAGRMDGEQVREMRQATEQPVRDDLARLYRETGRSGEADALTAGEESARV